MTFEEAKAAIAKVNAEVDAASAALQAFPKTGSMGLTPDHVKASPEWQAAKRLFDVQFSRLRSLNGWYVKAFKAEIRAERAAR